METIETNHPLSAYSWEIISEAIAVKQMDKSSFLHHGTVIPKEIAPFFNLSEADLNSPKPVLMEVNGKAYDAHFQMDLLFESFRLFWKFDFSNLIKNRYPELHKTFAHDESTDATPPRMQFERINQNYYIVEFIDPAVTASDWTDEELEAAVKAYFDMLALESQGEKYSKAAVNRALRSNFLGNRSKGAVEFRMQDISAVLQELCHPIIKGYLPRGNVGVDVSERIKKIIFEKNLLCEGDYQPTSDSDELDKKVTAFLSKGLIGKPAGQSNPKKQQTPQISYERDPLVKAWILQNAKGICELCDQQGPFTDKSGKYFLEAHHVVFLSQGGEDSTENAVALCPNCHKKCHHAPDTDAIRGELRKKIERIHYRPLRCFDLFERASILPAKSDPSD